MLDIIKSVLKKTGYNSQSKQDSLGDAEMELQIATCVVLLEIAHADDEFSSEEEQRIEQVMKAHFNLSDKTFCEIKAVSEKKRNESIDLWQFTNTIKDNYSHAQKEKVIEMIWQIIYADKILDKYEDYLAHRFAKLLGLSHKQLINAKLMASKKVRSTAL